MIGARVLNRTLLQRQHLLERTSASALEVVEQLVGLQAQETLAPYVGLWSRITDFDPTTLSDALESRAAVRLLLMRGTVHLVTAADAVALRPLVQPHLDRALRTSPTSRAAAELDRAELVAATLAEVGVAPVGLGDLGDLLSTTFPDVPPSALATAARLVVPLVQVPPRGLWKQSGGVRHQSLPGWLGTDPDDAPDDSPDRVSAKASVVRRYLRAFGPATPADLTAWSGTTDARAAFRALGDELGEELTVHRDEDGRDLFDLAGLALADPDQPAPVRLLGRYDNLWLSHQARDRVTPDPDKRRRWMGPNGGTAATVLVDGVLEGLWRPTDSGAVDVELFRDLTTDELAGLDAEVASLERFLAR